VFTRALLERGVPEQMLALVESHSIFARLLRLRFPGARVFCLDAARLGKVPIFDGASAGAVVSGLPLLSMSRRKVMAILGASFRHLRPDASFYQFTYGSRCPVPRVILDRLGLKARRLGAIAANVPPATVYRIHRRRRTPLMNTMTGAPLHLSDGSGT
jgi:phospholipid N-methyltransferase